LVLSELLAQLGKKELMEPLTLGRKEQMELLDQLVQLGRKELTELLAWLETKKLMVQLERKEQMEQLVQLGLLILSGLSRLGTINVQQLARLENNRITEVKGNGTTSV
jgi:hypothetical protein